MCVYSISLFRISIERKPHWSHALRSQYVWHACKFRLWLPLLVSSDLMNPTYRVQDVNLFVRDSKVDVY